MILRGKTYTCADNADRQDHLNLPAVGEDPFVQSVGSDEVCAASHVHPIKLGLSRSHW